MIHVQMFCVSKSFIAVHASVNQASYLTVISSGRLHTPSNKRSNQRAKIAFYFWIMTILCKNHTNIISMPMKNAVHDPFNNLENTS